MNPSDTTDVAALSDSQLWRWIQLGRESANEARTPWTAQNTALLAALEAEGRRRGLPQLNNPASQEQRDRAHEWTAESYPDAEGERYEALFSAALTEIVALDAAADRSEARLARVCS